MAFYENTIVARQDLAEKELLKIKDKYSELINSSDGKVIKVEGQHEISTDSGDVYKCTNLIICTGFYKF